MDRMEMGPRYGLWLGAAALTLGVVLGAAEAAKPASAPLVLTGTGGYAEGSVFSSDDGLTAAQGEPETAHVDRFSMLRALEIDASGALYTAFLARDTSDTIATDNNALPRQEFSGIVRHHAGTTSIVLSGDYTYDGEPGAPYSEENYSGEWLFAFDRVPGLQAGATGPLAEGDLIALRWVDRDLTNGEAEDDAVEVVQLRPTFDGSGAFTGLDELAVLHTFPVPGAFGGQIACDPLGQVFVSISDENRNPDGTVTRRYWLLSDVAGSFVKSDFEPPFDIEAAIDVDDDGNLYVLGEDHQENSGVIYQLPAGGDPATDYAPYSDFDQVCCINAFEAWGHDGGTFAIGLRHPR